MSVATADRRRGMTLIEVMVVVVILAILAVAAYPSYLDHVRGTRRADARQALMSLASAMERHHGRHLSYEGAAAGGGETGTPGIFAGEAPLDGKRKYYDLRITSASVDDYTLRALPKNGQEGDGLLQVTADGSRAWDRDGDGGIDASERCWDRKC